MSVVLTTTLVQAPPAVGDPSYVNLPALQQEKSVPGLPVHSRPLPPNEVDQAIGRPFAPAQWPGTSSAEVALAGKPAASFQKAGNLPISVSAPAALAAKSGSKVKISTFDQAHSAKTGVTGLVFAVDDAGGAAGSPLSVRVDYGGFANAYGGDYGSRLTLIRLPDCAATTPEKAECRTGSPVHSSNNVKGHAVTAEVTLPATQKSATAVFAVAAAPSGAGGSFGATNLSPAGQWSAGGSSGDFTYSIPLRVPPPTAGIAPKIGLGYSSGTVDGRTSSSNNQAGLPGDGWELSAGGGFIERRYQACADDLGGNNGQRKTGDLCWKTDNAIMSLNGVSAELVRVAGTNTWRPKNDDGSKIELLTGAANGDNNGEYWKITSSNGTQYFLGLNRLPGWSAGKPETNSAFTVPVFGNHAGEDCNQAAFANSWCLQGWRWNLDYVVDTNGNAATYYYDVEKNFYGRDQDAGKQTEYVAAGNVRRIEYGLRSTNLYAPAPSRVWFDTAERCLPTPGFACNPDQLTAATAASWPDVPFDRICKAGDRCENRFSPSFFTRKRLVKVLTQVRRDDVTGDAQWRDVDSWALKHEFPDTGDGLSPALWLASITVSGHVGGTVSQPDIIFHGRSMPNRVEAGDGLPPITRFRVERVRNEAGGITEVKYSDRECVYGSNMPVNPESNTKRCYPSWWLPEFGQDQVLGWFHKYVATDITEDDRTGSSVLKKTHYDYLENPAWHFDDNDFTDLAHRTWSQWRGYGKVQTTVGEPGTTQGVTVERFLRGMDGDRLPGNGKRTVTVTDSDGRVQTDSEWLAGFALESQSYNGATLDSVSMKVPWVRGPTATAGEDNAYMTNIGAVHGRTLLSDGTWRRTSVVNSFDDHGNTTRVDDAGDTAVTGDETCATTTYAVNEQVYILTRPATIRTIAKPCANLPGTAADVVAESRTSYDGQAFGTTPTKGNLTATERWTGTAWQLTQKTTYDDLGRPVEVEDSEGGKSRTAYSPAGGEFGVRTVTKTDPKGFTAVTEMDPARSLVLDETDISGRRADMEYDPLGRLLRVWAPGNPKGPNTPANSVYEYEYKVDAPTVVTTKSLREDGNYNTSYTLYDGLLRERQTQIPAVGGGRVLNDWHYDSRGLQVKVNGAYYNQDEPTKSVLDALDNSIPNQTTTEFDALGRETEVIYRKLGVEQWRTSSSYGGDRTTVVPPPGGTTTTVIRDVHGRATEKRQYHGRQPTGAYDSTRYAFTARGLQDTITAPDGSQWSYEYDALGRNIAEHDPDSGTTSYTYNSRDQLETSTDARGMSTRAEYDVLGRKVAEYERRGPGQPEAKVASWGFDAVKPGLADTATRYVGTKAYTSQVLTVDASGRPTKSKLTIPDGEDKLTGSYEFESTFDNRTGRLLSQIDPAAGGLDAEAIYHRYNEVGLPTETYGVSKYVPETLYSKYGEALRLTQGTGSKSVYTSMFYEEGTRRLSAVDVQRNLLNSAYLAKRGYTYDPAGNVTRLTDAPPGTAADTQCFGYDYLKRMTRAFTPADGDCAQQPTNAGLGGPAPYWHDYEYDIAGNRTKETEHAAAGDTVRTYAYGGPNGTQPHTLRSVTRTGPSGTAQDIFGYDATGNTTTRTVSGSTQQLEWDPAGRTEKVTEHDGRQSKYLYDADGGRLIKREAATTTLYVGDMELVLYNDTKTLTARRYYKHGDSVVAVRSTGPKAGLFWQLGDHQGTTSMTLKADTLELNQRRQDPFGQPRGTQSSTWPDDKGFVGGTKDDTGLTNLGARQYDPATGRFTSVDPVLDTDDPQQMNGYAYANNSPVTNSDPSGLYWKTISVAERVAATTFLTTTYIMGLFFPVIMFVPVIYWTVQIFAYRVWIDPPWTGVRKKDVLKESGMSAQEYEDAKKLAADKRGWVDVALQIAGDTLQEIIGVKGIIDSCIKDFDLLDCGIEIVSALPWYKLLKAGKIVDKIIDAFRSAKDWLRRRDRAMADLHRVEDVEERLASAGCNSFIPGTLVLLADGNTRPIEQLKLDDRVLAVDPNTGKKSSRVVVATIAGQGDKHLVDITLANGGAITATDGHPFWSATAGRWVTADDLLPGVRLLDSSGRSVEVSRIQHRAANLQVHNLSVDADHVYFVVTGSTSVLVHNCTPIELKYKDGWTDEQIAQADAKVDALNNNPGGLVVTKPDRKTSAVRTWTKSGRKSQPGYDVDHTIDLQLGGADDVSNMQLLDTSVNRSLGSQISAQIKSNGLQPGDRVCSVTISVCGR
ncbi:RHS repeat-associated core domain-containing protein [Actinokineospora enzanensis]|uniref:RHS repeat-associated core domain-containing protein n=1 Tax=Actinokineospora enzanensis TaxID=155975 RepID=UPI0003A7BC0A|nr:RHS repeat-associated core domain-containing protein [Actinokineospora enzanensis]